MSDTKITHVATVGVPVTDHDRALEFYTKTLGMEVRMDAEFAPGMRWIEVAPPGAITTVALIPPSDEAPAGVDTGIRLATTDAASDHEHLRTAGADVDAEVLNWPGVPPMFVLRDPDGNRLTIVERPA